MRMIHPLVTETHAAVQRLIARKLFCVSDTHHIKNCQIMQEKKTILRKILTSFQPGVIIGIKQSSDSFTSQAHCTKESQRIYTVTQKGIYIRESAFSISENTKK